jgi:hypothetical protein
LTSRLRYIGDAARGKGVPADGARQAATHSKNNDSHKHHIGVAAPGFPDSACLRPAKC